MKHRKRGALGLILSAAIGLGMVGGAAANSYMTGAVDGDETLVSGCVIRFLPEDDGRPSIHANGAHLCAGIKSVDISAYGEVRIHQTIDDPASNPILFAQCQTDETIGGERGVICGASGGTDTTRFRLWDTVNDRRLDLTQQSHRHYLMHDNANLWVGLFHTGGAR